VDIRIATLRNFIRVTLSSALLTGAILLAAQSFDLHQFQEGLGSFGAGHLSVVIGAIMVSSLFASLRVRSIAAGLGYQMSVRDSIAVLSLGQLGGAHLLSNIWPARGARILLSET